MRAIVPHVFAEVGLGLESPALSARERDRSLRVTSTRATARLQDVSLHVVVPLLRAVGVGHEMIDRAGTVAAGTKETGVSEHFRLLGELVRLQASRREAFVERCGAGLHVEQ